MCHKGQKIEEWKKDFLDAIEVGMKPLTSIGAKRPLQLLEQPFWPYDLETQKYGNHAIKDSTGTQKCEKILKFRFWSPSGLRFGLHDLRQPFAFFLGIRNA